MGDAFAKVGLRRTAELRRDEATEVAYLECINTQVKERAEFIAVPFLCCRVSHIDDSEAWLP